MISSLTAEAPKEYNGFGIYCENIRSNWVEQPGSTLHPEIQNTTQLSVQQHKKQTTGSLIL